MLKINVKFLSISLFKCLTIRLKMTYNKKDFKELLNYTLIGRIIMSKKTVFLTGASGNMGYAGFKEIYKRKDKYNLVLLLRNSEKNHIKFKD